MDEQRKKLIAELEETGAVDSFDHEVICVKAGAVKAAIELLKAQEVPDNGGWVSVKDRMPEKQTPVLVYVPPYSDEDEEYIGHVAMSYYTHSARGGYWAGTDGNIYGAIGIIHEPTHWMPLPTPPEEKCNDD